MNVELGQLKSKEVFQTIEKPKGEKIISTKWVFKIKRDQTGAIERFKARHVARDFAQEEGVNFFKTYAQKKTD